MENMTLANITLGQAWAWILAALAAFITISKVIDIIAGKLKPHRDIQKRLDEIDRKLNADKDRLNEQEKANGVIFRALFAQINHEISGNGDDILRKSRDEINEYLTKR